MRVQTWLKDDSITMDWREQQKKKSDGKKKEKSDLLKKQKIEKALAVKRKNRKQRDLMGKKLIALTFDDGPNRGTTERLLDVLKEKEVQASFFVIGIMSERAPDLAKRAKKEGHEVGNHTTYHKDLRFLSAGAIQQDVGVTNNLIKSATGEEPKILRPPYGSINETVRLSVGLPMILWNIDPRDWEVREVEHIYSQVMAQAKDGGIILLHDVYDATVGATPKIIDSLRANGYEFVTVGELARLRGVALTAGQIYYDFRL